MKDKILSIQSKLVYGYVGSNIAELAIQLHGLDVISFPTVLLSAHTGHQPVHGTKIDKALFDDLILGVKALELSDSVANIITGYIGSSDVLGSVVDYVASIKENYPNMLYICDPVMGDEDGLYVEQAVAQQIMDSLLPLCDVTTPNHFEFDHIVGRKTTTEAEVIDAIVNHKVLKDKIVIVTSCSLTNTAPDEIETLIVKGENCKRITAKRIAIDTTGTGDLFTAIVASQLAQSRDIISSVSSATDIIKRALDYTVEQGNVEMNAACLLKSIR